MVAPRVSDAIVIMSVYVVNSIFSVALIIFVKGLPRDFRYGLKFITTV